MQQLVRVSTSSATTLGTSLSGAITIPSTIPYGDGDASYNVTTIRSHAFYQCSSLISVTLPTNPLFTTIGLNAFYQCSNLTSITIPDSVTTIGSSVFLQCTRLTSVDLQAGNSLTTIGSNAFFGCSKITSITIPDSIETIGSTAFYQCSSLTSINIPDSVTTIGSHAFNGIASSSTVYVKNVDPNKTQLEGLEYIGGPGRDHEASDGGLMDGKISGTVTYQLDLTSTPLAPYLSDVSYAYDGTTKYSATVGSMDLEGDNFTFDLSGADADSFNLTTYDPCNNALLESVNPWDLNEPFTYSVTIKATDSTDLSAISLVSIAKTATVTDLSTNNISGSTLKTLADQSSVSPKDLYDVGYTVDQLVAAGFSYWNYTLDASNNATIGNNSTNFGNATFLGTSLSGAITIPSTIDGYNVTTIGSQAFYNCSSLTSIDLGNSVTSIGQHAFRDCTSLTSIDLPNSVESIGQYAFFLCAKLTSIIIRDSVTSIGTNAFNTIASSSTVIVINTDPTKTLAEGLEYIGGPGLDHVSDGGLMDGKITGIVTYLSLTSTPIAPYLFDVSYAYDGTTKYSATISSMDLEGDNLTFDLSGTDATSFQINYDACNNALLESVNPWDLNSPFAYSVTIKATDSTGFICDFSCFYYKRGGYCNRFINQQYIWVNFENSCRPIFCISKRFI